MKRATYFLLACLFVIVTFVMFFGAGCAARQAHRTLDRIDRRCEYLYRQATTDEQVDAADAECVGPSRRTNEVRHAR